MKGYTYNDLKRAYKILGLSAGMTVSVKTDLTRLGIYESRNKAQILADHYRALSEAVDLDKGTIVVPTTTTYLCETSQPYDPVKSQATTGIFTEYVRGMPQAKRSFHAFESYAAVGQSDSAICGDVSRFGYGIDSPEERLVRAGAYCVVIGASYERCCSTIHHLEAVVGVPYRYTKEIIHPVRDGSSITDEVFYRNVWYKRARIKKDTTRFFERLRNEGFNTRQVNLGNGWIVMYNLRELYELGVPIMLNDPYVVLHEEPEVKPWQE